MFFAQDMGRALIRELFVKTLTRPTASIRFGHIAAKSIEPFATGGGVSESTAGEEDTGTDWTGSAVMAERGIAVSERFGGMRFFGAHILLSHADYLFGLGRWAEAEAAARRAEESEPLGTNQILAQEMLARLALARGRRDEYLGTLVDAWLAEGGAARAVRAGEAYVDVGTLHGWHEALALLAARARAQAAGLGAEAGAP
jgi:hypothetical protein